MKNQKFKEPLNASLPRVKGMKLEEGVQTCFDEEPVNEPVYIFKDPYPKVPEMHKMNQKALARLKKYDKFTSSLINRRSLFFRLTRNRNLSTRLPPCPLKSSSKFSCKLLATHNRLSSIPKLRDKTGFFRCKFI